MQIVSVIFLGLSLGILFNKITIKLIEDRVDAPIYNFYINGKYALYLWSGITVVAFLLIYFLSDNIIKSIENAMIFLICLSIGTVDFAIKKIPNQLLLALILIKLIFISVSSSIEIIMPSIFGFFVGYIVFLIPAKLNLYIGAGDIKLAAVTGLYLGVSGFFQAMLIMSAILGLYYIYLKIKKAGGLKTSTPLGPHMVTGLMLTILFPLI